MLEEGGQDESYEAGAEESLVELRVLEFVAKGSKSKGKIADELGLNTR